MYLDWKDDPRDYYTIDIETDSLTPTVIWVMCWENIKTGETGECKTLDEINTFFHDKKSAVFVGHNILKFDGPSLVRLTAARFGVTRIVDTIVLSTLYSPNINEAHSLEAWGIKLGYPKIQFNDWSGLSDDMIEYCHRDVKITTILFKRLTKTLKRIGFSELSCRIQHHWTVILDRQTRNGFKFDLEGAINLYTELRKQERLLGESIRKIFPADRRRVRSGATKTKTGKPTAIFIRDCERYDIVETGDTYEAYENIEFNVGSPAQRNDKLMELGWVPEEFTPRTPKGGGGNPKPFEKGKLSPSLERFLEDNDVPEVRMIAEWMTINGRANMINTWMENYNDDTGCIHGKLYVADTLRLRHQAPNTANIPAVRTKTVDKGLATEHEIVLFGRDGDYTYESRNVWVARPDRILVGTDVKGLELRMLAHYINRSDFTKQVVEGDPHQYNADVVGIPRPTAKTLLYAIQYGAQGKKVASIIKSTVEEGTKTRQEFLDRLGLSDVMNGAIQEQKHGRIELVDRSFIVCPSPHSALNYKLQGGGARVMALASCILEGYIRSDGLDSLKVGDIHDEWQYDVHPKDADRHAERSIQAIREAGLELNLNLPLDGTAKKGLTWAQTH